MVDTVVITFPQEERGRPFIAEALGGVAEPVYLADLPAGEREAALRGASAVLARNTAKELRAHEPALLAGVRLIQFINAGVDFVPLSVFPAGVPIASNGGAYAEPMAEHALAMVLAAAKRLMVEHEALKGGVFNQHVRNRSLRGGVCGILGFGGIGVATARLMRALGMRIYAVNRRGASEEPVDWIGGVGELDTLLAASDVLVICTPLTPATLGLIGARELGLNACARWARSPSPSCATSGPSAPRRSRTACSRTMPPTPVPSSPSNALARFVSRCVT